MNCYIILYDGEGQIVTNDLIGSSALMLGDIIEHDDINYEVRKRKYLTSDDNLYVRAFKTSNS